MQFVVSVNLNAKPIAAWLEKPLHKFKSQLLDCYFL